MEVYRPKIATDTQLQKFHSEDYIDFLKKVSPENVKNINSQLTKKFGVGESTDCPIFDGLYDFCALYSGCSIDGAVKLNQGLTDIAINWSGGLHHAKKVEASGFCEYTYIYIFICHTLSLLIHIYTHVRLCERYSASYIRAPQASPARAVYRHRRAPRRRGGGGFLHHGQGHDRLLPQVRT